MHTPSRQFRCLVLALLAALSPARAEQAAFASNAEAERTIRALLVASPYKMSERARAGTIRYTLQSAASANGDAAGDWPETGEQHVEIHGERVTLTVCADCGREAAPSAAELQRHLAPNAWVDSDAGAIRAFARSATGSSAEARMSALVLAVQKHMSGAVDFRHYASASQALASREGDCTEFAVLLAAAARARGIPARVVSGLVYDSRLLGRPHAFGPHTWVQAWTGRRWRSYDAALGRFDAGHIALRVGDGSAQETYGVMRRISTLRIVEAAGLLPPSDGDGSASIKDSAPTTSAR
jgi:transglutaminase-like putative cysteine protease